MLDLMATPPSIERITIWILEALDDERQREPHCLKCRLESEILGTLKDRHSIDDVAITKGLRFCLDRGYISRLKRPDGIATSLTDDGIRMWGQVQQTRLDEANEKAAADKAAVERRQDVRLKLYPIIIALLSLVVAYLAYRLAVSGHTATPP